MRRALLPMLLVCPFLVAVLQPVAGLAELQAHDPGLFWTILIELRLPRALLAVAYGALLGGAGAALQALFANPLASPDLTGATTGAALGAVVTGYSLGLTSAWALAAGGMIGAVGALLMLVALAGARAETATLLLAGVAINAAAAAAATLALALAPSPFAFYDAYEWLMGSLVDRGLPQAAFVAVAATLVLTALRRDAGALDLLALGEEAAGGMGVDLHALRRRIVLAAALGTGAGVAVCGAVGFVGLVAPVLARKLTHGHPGRAIIPAALIGAILLTAADLVVRLAPAGRPLPVGVVTALLGAPFFLALIARMRFERP